MKSHYTCSTCRSVLEATVEHFFPSSLALVEKDSNRSVIPKCKPCATKYAEDYRASLKARGLVRSRKTTIELAGAVKGTVYVIGTEIPGNPYKIGITSGSDLRKRKSALQTAHWLELKEVWKSDLLPRADIVEKKLHKHFENKLIRGEWFNITEQDINTIPELIKQFEVEL